MNEFAKWILGVTLTSAACSLLQTVLPAGSMEKSFRTVSAILIVAAIAAPGIAIMNGADAVKVPQYSAEDISDDYAQLVSGQMLAAADASAARAAIGIIPELEAEAVSIAAEAGFDTDNYLYVSKITVVLKEGSALSAENTASVLAEALNIPVEVTK